MLPLLLFAHFIQNAYGDCGYVDLTANIGSFFTVGEFILSANKCQSLSAQLNVLGSAQTVKGSIKFACDPLDTNTLIIKEYTNILCTGTPYDTTTIKLGQKTSLMSDNLYFTLNTLVCGDTDCAIDITFSADCRGTDSISYSNLAIPPNSCETFGGDFNNVLLQQIPYQIFPSGPVDGLFSTALEFKCCRQDHSLLIYNYSDSNCLSSTSYNTLRLSNEYNGECFALGNEQKPFDVRSTKASTNDVNSNDDVYAVRYKWNCDTFIDCTGIEFMDDGAIPNLCPDQCLEPGYVIHPNTMDPTTTFDTIEPTLAPTASNENVVIEARTGPTASNDGIVFVIEPTLSPSASPTFHPIPASEDHPVDVKPQRIIGNETSNITSIYIWIAIIGFCGVIGAVLVVFCVYRRRKWMRFVKDTQRESIEEKDSRYETMMVNINSGNNEEAVKDSKESVAGEYVLPSKSTKIDDRGESQNTVTLLSDK